MAKKIYLMRSDSEYGAVKSVDGWSNNIFKPGPHKNWVIDNYHFTKKKFKRGDFFYFSQKLGLHPRALDLIGGYLEQYGQLLPINIEGLGERFVFYVTNHLDCFNFDNSHYRNIDITEKVTVKGEEIIQLVENPKEINRVLFEKDACLNESEISAPLFCTKDRIHFMGPYVTSGFFPKSEELFHIYHENKLEGLKFIEVNIKN